LIETTVGLVNFDLKIDANHPAKLSHSLSKLSKLRSTCIHRDIS